MSYWAEDYAMAEAIHGRGARYLEDTVPDRAADLCRFLPHRFAQVDVPIGHEQAVADDIRTDYLEMTLRIGGPDALMQTLRDPVRAPVIELESAASTSVSSPSVGGAGTFAFSVEHYQTYLPALGRSWSRPTPFGALVGVLDTGWANPVATTRIAGELDLTTASPVPSAADNFGHGSVVTAIIDDVATNAVFQIYRVAAVGGQVREWTFLAGLAAAAADACDVINASVGFGLKDRSCGVCGRDYGSTRARVFERLLSDVLQVRPDTIFVAAAGNNSATAPAYPARFANAVCVASTDGAGELSTFSNRGAVDQDGAAHSTFVLAPGGDRFEPTTGLGTDQYVASFLGTDWRGTSFAAAYVSGVLADYVASAGTTNRQYLIAGLVSQANPSVINAYSAAEHGAGQVTRI